MSFFNNLSSLCKGYSKFALVWMICIVTVFFIVVRTSNSMDMESVDVMSSAKVVDAVVYIAMGKIAHNSLVDYSIASVRKIGEWEGDIYVITDQELCFSKAIEKYNIKPIVIPPMNTIINIKSLKTTMFEHLPSNVQTALYIDIDILVAKSLRAFLRDLSLQIYDRKRSMEHAMKKSGKNSTLNEVVAQVGMFPDAKGHYVGYCAGCEKWHTGVIWYTRPIDSNPQDPTRQCLRSWKEVLLSGKYETDQQSMDDAEARGHCPHMISFLTQHLLFAKDYIGMIFLDTPTFWHITGAGRMDEQDSFYRYVVLPRIYDSLRPVLSPSILNMKKEC